MKTEIERWKEAIRQEELCKAECDRAHSETEKSKPRPFETKEIRVVVTAPESVNLYLLDKAGAVRTYATLTERELLNLGAYIKAVFGENPVVS